MSRPMKFFVALWSTVCVGMITNVHYKIAAIIAFLVIMIMLLGIEEQV